MLKYQPVDEVFRALGDPTRRDLVERLSGGPATVSQLARPLDMSLSAVVQHLAVLESCGVVRSEKVGRTRTCGSRPSGCAWPRTGSPANAPCGSGGSTGWGRSWLRTSRPPPLRPKEEREHDHQPERRARKLHRHADLPRPARPGLHRVFQPGSESTLFGASGTTGYTSTSGWAAPRTTAAGPWRSRVQLRGHVPGHRADERIVYGYVIHADDTLISVSVTTGEFSLPPPAPRSPSPNRVSSSTAPHVRHPRKGTGSSSMHSVRRWHNPERR